MNYRTFASQYFSHYSRAGSAYPLQLPVNGKFMRRHMLCVVGNPYKRALTVGAHGDVFYRLIDSNWQFASAWADRMRHHKEFLRLNVRQAQTCTRTASQILGLHAEQLKAHEDSRKQALKTLLGPQYAAQTDALLNPANLEREAAFYLKNPSQPVDFLEEICADAAIDFFRACSYYRGKDLAHPSLLVRAFIREWAANARHAYDDMLDFFNLHERPPHTMPAFGRARTEESQEATARTWKALSRLDDEDKTGLHCIPNLYRIDELMGLVDRFDYRAVTDPRSGTVKELQYRGRGYLGRSYEGADGGWEVVEATQADYLLARRNLLRAQRTRGIRELRDRKVLIPEGKRGNQASAPTYRFQAYARDEQPNMRLQLSLLGLRNPALFQLAPRFEPS